MKKIKILSIILFLSFLNVSYSQYGWYSQQPNWTNWIVSVKFLNENTGFTAGWGGYISKTTNGGVNWFSIAPSGTSCYQSLVFLNENTGWVTGVNGVMIKTTNGGQNWLSLYSGTEVILNELKFLDFNTGWAVGYSGTIIKTTNGGINWVSQYTGTSNNLTSIFFLNATEGWAAGDYGKVLKTTNGGFNWVNINVGITNNTSRISFINANTGWIGGTGGLMLKTTDAGNSWTLLNSGTSNYIIMVNFLNASTGFAIGAYGTIIRTNNGGNNWILQTCTSTNNLREIFMLNENTGWIAGDNGTMLKTTTGGYSAPQAPSLVSPPDNSLSQPLTPTMIWSNSGGDFYTIQISTNPTFNVISDSTTVATTQYIVPSGKLQTALTYFWRVRATNSYGTSSWSNVWNFATYTGPSAPLLIAPVNGALNVTLTPTFDWSDVTNAINYLFQVSTDSLFNTIVDSSTVTLSQYTEPSGKLNSGIVYYWRVRACNNNGSGLWSSIWKLTTASVPPAPTLIFPSNGMIGVSPTPILDWDSLASAQYYKVQISTVSNFAIITDSATVNLSKYSVPTGKLLLNYTYFWRVNGFNNLGTGPWSSVWRFTVSTIGLGLISQNVPAEYKFYSNYPNPFNPATKIKFDLPKKSHTSLIVYDALGKTVQTLVNTELKEGTYEYTWDASKYNSGVYFVRIISDKFAETRKMLLVK
jgi:photosystem II stability/assembly factor-like uncharacterized protein